MIITRFNQLIKHYHGLGPGDVYVGKVPSSPIKSTLLADLTDRGVGLLPTATAQILNGSKVAQAFVLNSWMVPHTLTITRRNALLDALTHYHQAGITTAVTKSDHLHCGHGICKWDNLETLYSCLTHHQKIYPFVLQPFVAVATDVRVIMVGEFCEAYSRRNPHNFRMNLAGGGHSRPYKLTSEQCDICHQVLERSRMPYGHIDLMIDSDGAIYFSEIRLNGGIHGAQIDRHALKQMKQAHLKAMAHQIMDSYVTAVLPNRMETV